MGTIKYLIEPDGERFQGIVADSEDTLAYHCPSCHHHSGTDAWEYDDDGPPGFVQRERVCG